MAPIKALILDLDGCLVDSKEGILESFCVSVQQAMPGLKVDPAKVRVGPPINVMYQQTFPTLTDAALQSLTLAYRAHYDTVGLKKTTLYPGGPELLRRCLKIGVTVDIATNKPIRAAGAILSNLNLGSYLRSVTAVDARQPPFAGKTELLQYVCKLNHIDLRNTLYVGDTAEDLCAARDCGLEFVLAAYGYGDAVHPRAIQSLGELVSIVDGSRA